MERDERKTEKAKELGNKNYFFSDSIPIDEYSTLAHSKMLLDPDFLWNDKSRERIIKNDFQRKNKKVTIYADVYVVVQVPKTEDEDIRKFIWFDTVVITEDLLLMLNFNNFGF